MHILDDGRSLGDHPGSPLPGDHLFSPLTIVASITSAPARIARPTDVAIMPEESGLSHPSRVLLNQIRTLDKRRLERPAGQLSPERVARVDEALKISLEIVPL